MKHTALTLILISLLLLLGCQPPANTNQNSNANVAGTSNPKWDAHVEQYLNEYFSYNPTFAVYQGKHEFDGKLPDWSEEGLTKQIDFLKDQRAKAAGFKDDQLDERQRFERDYLIAQIDGDLFWRETVDSPHMNPYFYSGPLDPDVYVSRPYAPLETRIKAYTTYARNVPVALEHIKKNLRLPLAAPLIKIGRTTIGGLAGSYETDIAKVFSEVKDEQSQKEFA